MKKQVPLFLVLSLLFRAAGLSAQTGRITGQVKLADGTPLPGVTVSIAQTLRKSITDAEGIYNFEFVPK